MSGVVERTAPAPSAAKARRSMASIVQGVAIALGFVMLVGGFGVIATGYRPFLIPTASMSPTLESGDTVLARKVDGGSVGRGDIVVFREPLWGGAVMVKRVVAVGGDTVACCDAQHRLLVNGTPIDEPYLPQQMTSGAGFTTTVPAGRLFLLGDFRDNSLDSRSHLDVASGTIAASDVTGRVEGTVWPFDRMSASERTVAFDRLGGAVASRPGLLEPAAYVMVGGAALIVLASAAGGVVSLGRRARRRSG
ncbi:signal peptidase I [Kitasatospora atroaurantiaca]|nr:signal peptidase I [Kitasatospora atroaurantiaca]